MLEANTLRLEKLPGDLAGPGQAHDQGSLRSSAATGSGVAAALERW